MSKTITVLPSSVRGAAAVPSSKSHTIRALLLAACADGTSHIENVLDSGDARSCIGALQSLGVAIEETGRSATGVSVTITPPAGGITRPRKTSGPVKIDVGNSGTTMYMLAALAALRREETFFDGDQSIRSRDAQPLLDALSELGARVTGGPAAPFSIAGPLQPGLTVELSCPTSQYLSALLLAAPGIADEHHELAASAVAGEHNELTASDASGEHHELAASETAGEHRRASSHLGTPGGERPAEASPATTIVPTVLFERPYVDMTCWWLDRQGIQYRRRDYREFSIAAGQRYAPVRATLPGDYSSATFWFAAAAITGGAVTVEGLAPDDVQGDRQVLGILRELGCNVEWSREDEAVPTVTVTGPVTRGGSFDLNAMPDALPALAAVACYAPEPVAFTNVSNARAKETDRIAVIAEEFSKLGGVITELPDGLRITPSRLSGGTLRSHGDHRIAMAAAIAALGASGPVSIVDAEAAAVTYPAFFPELFRLAPEAGGAHP